MAVKKSRFSQIFIVGSMAIVMALSAVSGPATAQDTEQAAVLPPTVSRVMEAAYARGTAFFDETVNMLLGMSPKLSSAILAKAANLRRAGDVPATPRLQGSTPAPAAVVVESEAVEEDEPEGLFGWDSKVELGLSNSTGDTDDQSAHLGITLERVFSDRWDHSLSLDADFERANSVTSRERYYGDYALYYRGWDRAFGFTFVQAENDRFSGFDYEVSESIGIGYSIFKEDGLEWDVQGGPGLRHTKDDLAGPMTHFAGFANSKLTIQITENLLGVNNTKMFIGSDRFSFRNEVDLQATVTESLSAQFSLLLNYDSKVPAGSAKFDTVTRASLVYTF